MKKQKVGIKMLLQKKVKTNIKMFCSVKNAWGIRWIGFKVKIGTYKIKKISLSWFDDKICIQNNGYDGLLLGY